MIPSVFAPDTVSVAERRFFVILSEQLDDDFTVIHSVPWLKVNSRRLRQGECDFLILHPVFGMLAIEVKPGDVHYDGMSELWRRKDGSSLGKDPYHQSQRSSAALNEILRQRVRAWSEMKLAHGFAVVFSEADQIQGRLPPHALPLITILHADTLRLQERIQSILAHYGDPLQKPRPDLIENVVASLRQEFQLIQTFSGQLERQEDGLRRLTARQIEVLSLMRDTKRLLIRGCAGSGKTLLALEKATCLSQQGQRVLLLCYNIPLADWLRSRVENEGLSVDVFHFHGLCQHLAGSAGLSFNVPTDSELLTEFYDHEAPDLFSQAVSCGAGPRYDAVIVDEGQDFIAEWWLPIEDLIAEKHSGTMYIFYDPEQNIFRRDFGFLVDEAKLTLDRNCRNTNQIAKYVRTLTATEMESAEFSVEGFAPQEYVLGSVEEELATAETIISEVVRKKGLSPDRVVIVGRHRYENSPYANCADLAGIRLTDESCGDSDSNAIRYATIFRFKGLEADCVILSGFRRPSNDHSNCELYCAASRAKLMLHVLYREI
ncbi:MAG: NERD domain-containing protein [Fuerstiella sp.]